MGRSIPVLTLLIGSTACTGADLHEVELELEVARLDAGAAERWPYPAIESGHPEITVRGVFTAQGPCRELGSTVARTYPGEYVLRVVAEQPRPTCPDTTRLLGYVAVLRGLPEGSHALRVVHVGADGRTLAETVFRHEIRVTNDPAR